MDKVELQIDKRPLARIKELEFERSITAMSGRGRYVIDNAPDTAWILDNLHKDAITDIFVNDRLVFSGYMDEPDINFSEVEVTFRDRISDLLECAAVTDGAHDYQDQKLETILNAVLKPFKIPLTIDVDTGKPFKRISITPGETAFELIERLCRYRSILPISDGVGGLHLVKPGMYHSHAKLRQGENIINGSMKLNFTELFSEIIFKGQEETNGFADPSETTGKQGRATDPRVKRYRPYVEVVETEGHTKSLDDRAKWRMQHNRAKAKLVNLEVAGFSSEGDLWMPNQIVSVDAPKLKLDQQMLITQIRMKYGEQGQTTSLSLTPPDAFDLPAEPPPSDNNIWASI